jgi:hypothetical protein
MKRNSGMHPKRLAGLSGRAIHLNTGRASVAIRYMRQRCVR